MNGAMQTAANAKRMPEISIPLSVLAAVFSNGNVVPHTKVTSNKIARLKCMLQGA